MELIPLTDEQKKKRKKKIIIICSIVGVILITAGLVAYWRYCGFGKKNNNTNTNPSVSISQTPVIKKVASKLDGIEYLEDVANRHPLGIMVENHLEARPQIGLDKAKIVYEVITEGGITRFLAIFGPEGAAKVGPVRSARTYYLDWCLEYDCFYSHVGGNLDALQLIPRIGIKDLDQFRYGTEAYWREPQKNIATEHTMFTDTSKLWTIAQNNSWPTTSDFTSLLFKDDALKDMRPETQTAEIDFSSANFKVKWTYDKENNNYKREMGGVAHKDRETGLQLTAKNIVIEEVTRWQVTTDINESGFAMKTVGEGKAKVLMDGKSTDATWKKADRNSRTRFYDSAGTEIKFDKGNTWMEIVPPEINVLIQ